MPGGFTVVLVKKECVSDVVTNGFNTIAIRMPDDDFILEMFENNKRHGISFKNNSKELIEFRTPNMTHNPILWQNYITFFYYLLEYVKN